MDSFKLKEKLAARREQHLYRERMTLESAQQPEVIIDGKPYIAFCSNDYLGLANHPQVKQAFIDAVQQYGVGAGSAHLVIGHHALHDKLENALAEFLGVPNVLLFSTGYMANLGVVNGLMDKKGYVFEDKLNHASLLDAGMSSGAKFSRYFHNDLQDLERKINKADPNADKMIITDGVFSMDGDCANLTALAAVAKKQNAMLMVDDAHGFGVLGESGRGLVNHSGLTYQDVPIQMGTLGKGFGTFGAFVAGNETIIDSLVQWARTYVYTTALPPAVAGATLESLKIIQQEQWRRDHLTMLIEHFKVSVKAMGLTLMPSDTPIQPIVVGSATSAMQLAQKLKDEGIIVTAIRPPTVPEGTARLRITFSASHTKAHVEKLLIALEKHVIAPVQLKPGLV